MTEDKFIKENDYTLTVERTEEQERDGYYIEVKPRLVSSVRRTFNFLSAQVTTVTRDWAYHGICRADGGSSSAVSGTMQIQNFDDIQSSAEIKFMYAKLVGMEGKPPALEEVLPNEMHKKSGSAPMLGKK